MTVVHPYECVVGTSNPTIVERDATLQSMGFDQYSTPVPPTEADRDAPIQVANFRFQSESETDKQTRINQDVMLLLEHGTLLWDANHLRARISAFTTDEGDYLAFHVINCLRNEESRIGESPVDLEDRNETARSAWHLLGLR